MGRETRKQEGENGKLNKGIRGRIEKKNNTNEKRSRRERRKKQHETKKRRKGRKEGCRKGR